jgi:hypothetical protein
MTLRCSSCGEEVSQEQFRCHKCGAVFQDDLVGSEPIMKLFGALTGNRSLDEIKEDWVFEARKAIARGTAKTLGVSEGGKDEFKSETPEVIEADFEVIEEKTENTRFKKASTIEDFEKGVQDALKKRLGKEEKEEK